MKRLLLGAMVIAGLLFAGCDDDGHDHMDNGIQEQHGHTNSDEQVHSEEGPHM